jgi:sulfur transfer complex TusBCD TusB component (DsrH family)
MRVMRLTWLFAALLSVAACARFPEIPFDRGAAGEIKTIGLVTPKFPDGPSVILATTIGRSFGLIGAVIDASMQHSREVSMTDLLRAQNFSTSDYFIASLTENLRAAGYEVVEIPVLRSDSEFLTAYPATQPKVDAYLDIVALQYGYVAAGIGDSTPYRPRFVLKTRLASAHDSSVLMQDAVIYNAINAPRNVVTISPESSQLFVNFDELMADPNATVTALKTATSQSAQTVGRLLR